MLAINVLEGRNVTRYPLCHSDEKISPVVGLQAAPPIRHAASVDCQGVEITEPEECGER